MRIYRVPMPFHGRFVDAIKDGTKDVTRRFTPRHIGMCLRAKIPNLKKRPSEWPGFANLIVVDCHSEMLHAIKTSLRTRDRRIETGPNEWTVIRASPPSEELKHEGFSSLDEFIKFWDMIYEKRPERQWDANPPVWRIQFRNEDLGQKVL